MDRTTSPLQALADADDALDQARMRLHEAMQAFEQWHDAYGQGYVTAAFGQICVLQESLRELKRMRGG